MITSELIEYIKSQLSENVSKELIIKELSSVGWHIEDIEEGFKSLETKEVKKVIDPYRELPDGEIPLKEKINEDLELKRPPVLNIPVIEIPTASPIVEPEKVWVPTSINPKVEEVKEEKKDEKIEFSSKKDLELYSLELPGEIKTVATPRLEVPIIQTPQIETKIPEKETIKEFLPTLNKAPVSMPTNNMSDIVPKRAMLSSYSQDILSAVKKEEVGTSSHKKNLALKLGIIIIILVLIGAMIFAFVKGYLKFPGSKFSFFVVKKDPKTVMLNIASTISKLKSYKTETNINISSPSLSNITTGLSSGEVVTSKDRDSVSINAKGSINHIDNKSLFDYNLNVKSSILKNEITTDLKYNGTDLSVSIPDLSQILGKDAPIPTTISMSRNQLGLIVPEFSTKVQDIIKKIDIYNIISNKVPLYLNNEINSLLKEFIGTLEYKEKGKEIIHGVETYNYEVVATRVATKKLLSSLGELFAPQLSPDQKKNLDESLGASTISSFEIWIGKNDDNLYQLKFTLDAPLSKVIGINDSGIAGNEVKLDWVSTFYDLDIENNIVLPVPELNMENFIKRIQDTKIKNIISSFKPQATIFRNAVGSYGKIANSKGSCNEPISGSMFSPLGHTKGADTAVSSISSSLNSLLLITKGSGSCYSTSKAWALAVPLSTDVNSFFCTDSEGNLNTLTAPIAGTACISTTNL